jgi:hypothetical protein
VSEANFSSFKSFVEHEEQVFSFEEENAASGTI